MSTRAIWDQGFPLSDADWQFASKALRDEYNSVVTKLNSTTPKPPEEPDFATSLQLIQHGLKSLTEPASVRWKMQDRLLGLLANRSFIAYGFAVPRHPNDLPIEVPTDLFEKRYVDWKNSALKGHGLEFAAVRVLHPATIERILAALPQPSPTPATRRPGAEPSAGKIEEAILALLGAKKLNPAAPHKVNIPLIRAQLHELFPGHFIADDKPSAEVIRKVWARLRRPSQSPT